MNWEAFGAIGEVVGAVAVVVTLLFLIAQLRQNTRALTDSQRATVSQLYQFRAQMHMDGMLRKAESSSLSVIDINRKIMDEGADSLTDDERLFLFIHYTADAVRLDNGLFQHKNGFLDDDYVDYIHRAIKGSEIPWTAIGLFDRGHFRRGFEQEVKRIWADGDA